MAGLLGRWIRWLSRRHGAKAYALWQEVTQEAANQSFVRSVAHIGPKCKIHHPFHIMNAQCISIGLGFWAGPGLRIEAWEEYFGQKYKPRVTIGDNVVFNYDVHIGAIGELHIGNGVMVGSRVLITDHSHGSMTVEELEMPARIRPLSQKGPVVIEENVWIGEGACILPGVRIGRNSVIGANAVVARDVAANTIVGGVPARLLRTVGEDGSPSSPRSI
jgi:acetyltransferase-like isoleucine patch superfamily enzyme